MILERVMCSALLGACIVAGLGCGDETPDDAGGSGAGSISDPTTAAGASAAGASGASSANAGAGAGGARAPVGGTGVGIAGVAGSTVGGGGMGGMVAVDCTITPSLTMSTAISTVGIVEFTTDLSELDSAQVEFGPDSGYGMTAPVDLSEPGYRTLLLGMKAAREYHYRVVATAGNRRCASADDTLQTGDLPNQPELIDIEIETPQPAKLDGGYSVSGIFQTGPAFILDADGDYVWWFDSGDTVSARMSHDGKSMWLRNSNVRGRDPLVYRVSMDGMQVDTFDLDSELGDSHHDFTVLPDETLAFIAHDAASGCDKIMERAPDGTVREIINAMEAHGSPECHINSVHYHPEDDTITFSDRIPGCYVKVTRSGEVLWILGGEASTFTGGNGLQWIGGQGGGQHGHHVLAPDRMLMFANGMVGSSSMVYELVLDEQASTAERVWEYDGGEQTAVLGDVQRLPNGNTLVTYTSAGTIHEVDPDRNLVQSLTWSLGGAVGYVQRRASLYGPPPR